MERFKHFISAFLGGLALILLVHAQDQSDGSLALFWRVDVGSVSNITYRYSDDVCDRDWRPFNYYEWRDLSTSLTIESPSSNQYRPPSVVMSTASTPIVDSAPLVFHWPSDDAASQYYIYFYFAEVVKLEPNQSRSFNFTLNGEYYYGPIVPDYLRAFTMYSKYAMTGKNNYIVSLVKTKSSTLPPIINSFLFSSL
ncbi:putative leucine-rich repeat receptor-like protein kinase At2g19210 [Fagus crenata]